MHIRKLGQVISAKSPCQPNIFMDQFSTSSPRNISNHILPCLTFKKLVFFNKSSVVLIHSIKICRTEIPKPQKDISVHDMWKCNILPRISPLKECLCTSICPLPICCSGLGQVRIIQNCWKTTYPPGSKSSLFIFSRFHQYLMVIRR